MIAKEVEELAKSTRAARDSKAYRKRQAAHGIPGGREIDRALATRVMTRILEQNGPAYVAEYISQFSVRIATIGGWDHTNKDVLEAIEARLALHARFPLDDAMRSALRSEIAKVSD